MKPLVTEKAVMLIEAKNTLVFETDMKKTKIEIKKEIEEIFNVKVEKINTLLRKNKKYAYVKLNSKNPAIDVATKLGMI
ncbi:50S ribosomal protein L23 [Candidatus Pacearchaeota archaeon]|nr:50S ribosomal protein L23 [Candidatus Pacearchaeota archaeon]